MDKKARQPVKVGGPFTFLLALLVYLFALAPGMVEAKPNVSPNLKFPPSKEFGYELVTDLKLNSLFDFPLECEVYRFIYCDAWMSGVIITMTREKGVTLIRTIQPADQVVNGVRHIANDMIQPMSSKNWEKLERFSRESRFWKMPSPIRNPGEDGFTFILEARVEGKYHYVARWAPGDTPQNRAFASLGAWIINIGNTVGTVRAGGYGLTTKDGIPIILGK